MSKEPKEKMEEDVKAIFAGVGMFASGLAYIAASLLLRGFILHKLWGWHVQGVLTEVSLGTLQALGMILVFRVIEGNSYLKSREENSAPAWKSHLDGWTISAFALLVGWLVHVAL